MNNTGGVYDEAERIVNLALAEAAEESERIRGFCEQIAVYERIPVLPLAVGIIISLLGLWSLKFFSSPYPILEGFYILIGLGSVLFLGERSLGIFFAKKQIKRLIRERVESLLALRG